jgi:hypothetical protein
MPIRQPPEKSRETKKKAVRYVTPEEKPRLWRKYAAIVPLKAIETGSIWVFTCRMGVIPQAAAAITEVSENGINNPPQIAPEITAPARTGISGPPGCPEAKKDTV